MRPQAALLHAALARLPEDAERQAAVVEVLRDEAAYGGWQLPPAMDPTHEPDHALLTQRFQGLLRRWANGRMQAPSSGAHGADGGGATA